MEPRCDKCQQAVRQRLPIRFTIDQADKYWYCQQCAIQELVRYSIAWGKVSILVTTDEDEPIAPQEFAAKCVWRTGNKVKKYNA